jgi:hypothetical protein
MQAAAAARKGNHRRTKSTHPDELSKMMLSIGKDSSLKPPLLPQNIVDDLDQPSE